MKEKIEELIDMYSKRIDMIEKSIHDASKKGRYLDIQYLIGNKHQLQDSIKELKEITNHQNQ